MTNLEACVLFLVGEGGSINTKKGIWTVCIIDQLMFISIHFMWLFCLLDLRG